MGKISKLISNVEKEAVRLVKKVLTRRREPISKAAQTIFNPTSNRYGRRIVLVDGTNVALSSGEFSVQKLQNCLDALGSSAETYAIVPQFRLKQRYSSNNRQLQQMQRDGKVVITPGKDLNGQILTSDPNPIIFEIAKEFEADVVSNHDFQEVLKYNRDFQSIINNRLVGFTCDSNGFCFFRRGGSGSFP